MRMRYNKMKNHKFEKVLIIVFFICFRIVRVYAQEPILFSYQRNFIRASLATKASLLNDAAKDEKAAEFSGGLYETALKFVLDNGELLKDDPDMIALLGIAARGAGGAGNKRSAETLWEIFQIYRDSHSRVELLKAMGSLGKDNRSIIENLNQYLANQNNSFRSGMLPDYPVLGACVNALGALGDSSSYPVLFSAMTCGYPQVYTDDAAKALESLKGDYKEFLVEVIKKNPPPEKLAAFRLGALDKRFKESERGELAETALAVTLEFKTGSYDNLQAASSLRYAAVQSLTALKWARASSLVIRNYYQVQTDFSNNAVPKERLLEAIACVGAMGNSESAQVLALQLGYFNSQMESRGEYDEDIIAVLIKALGEIGDKVAFDYLLYIGYLNYPEQIQNAAREALARLKW
ncbi:MAG: hypothetical protein LBF78_13255 [Treponema sp.]|jgi:hypothetical protein|nr:hypothetical protein [Treponema sp.]